MKFVKKFRMYDSNIGYSTDNFTTLSYNGGTNVFELNSSDTLAASILYPETKKIELRTVLYFPAPFIIIPSLFLITTGVLNKNTPFYCLISKPHNKNVRLMPKF